MEKEKKQAMTYYAVRTAYPRNWNAVTAPARTARPVSVNVTENKESFLIEVAAPGFSKEQLSAQVEDRVLTIAGKVADTKDAGARYRHQEFQVQPFERKFNLPEIVIADAIQASFENGILVVTLPKMQPVVRQIDVQ